MPVRKEHSRSKLIQGLENALLLLAVLLFLGLFVEYIVFGVVYVGSDLPELSENRGGVLKYKPGQKGTYRIKNEIAGTYSINNAGWNSAIDYVRKKETDKLRICLIGDSTIEALQVPVTKTVSANLRQHLGDKVDSVYSFALSGAPFSHYIFMLENEVIEYEPDIVVIHLASSDLIESVYPSVGAYPASLGRLGYDPNRPEELFEQEPLPYTRDPISLIKSTNTYQYLRVRQQLRLDWLKQILLDLILQDKNIGLDRINDGEKIQDSESLRTKIAAFLIGKAYELSQEHSFRLIFLIDGDRPSIYELIDNGASELPEEAGLSRIVAEIASQYGISVIKLQEAFYAHYKNEKSKVNFELDLHWNEIGHRIVAETLIEQALSDFAQ
jgi:hypothetical protein